MGVVWIHCGIGPVAKAGISIRVCDTLRPDLDGTIITATTPDDGIVKAISVRKSIVVFNLDHGPGKHQHTGHK